MYQMIEDWHHRIDAVTAAVEQACSGRSDAELNIRPHAGTWSMAQVLDHLIVTNSTYFPVIEQVRAGTYRLPFIARAGFMVRFFGKFILQAVEPTRKKKMRTFPIWEPTQSDVPDGIVQRFVQHQMHLKAWMLDCSDLLEAGVIISSPANRTIVYTLPSAFEIITTHEERHLNQLLEISSQLPGSQHMQLQNK